MPYSSTEVIISHDAFRKQSEESLELEIQRIKQQFPNLKGNIESHYAIGEVASVVNSFVQKEGMDYVCSEGELMGKNQVFYDLFRVKDGKIVEHWDVIQEIPTEGLAHNNGMFGF